MTKFFVLKCAKTMNFCKEWNKFENKIFKLLIVAILQAMPAVCSGISLKKIFKLLIVAVLQALLAVCRGIKKWE